MYEVDKAGHATPQRAYNDQVVMYGLNVQVGAPDIGLSFLPWYKPCDASSLIQSVDRLDAEDEAVLADEATTAHIVAASDAHERARSGEEVDWESVIQDHILG